MENLLVIIALIIIIGLWILSVTFNKYAHHKSDIGQYKLYDQYRDYSFYCSIACYILAFLFVIITGAIWLAMKFEGNVKSLLD